MQDDENMKIRSIYSQMIEALLMRQGIVGIARWM